jgi:UDP-N-acetylglucosamine acyltransferase
MIEDYAVIGGLAAVHQFCRIGIHAFISGLTGVALDIPPYMLAAGNRAKLFGLNTVGLKRQNFTEETIRALKTTYRIIFRSGLTLENAMKKVGESELSQIPEVQHLLQFIQQTKRGISR